MGGGRPPGCWWFIGFVRLRRSEGSAVWIGMTATTVVLVLLCMYVCVQEGRSGDSLSGEKSGTGRVGVGGWLIRSFVVLWATCEMGQNSSVVLLLMEVVDGLLVGFRCRKVFNKFLR